MFLIYRYEYLASGDLMKSVARQFWVGESTASQIIRETCNVLWIALKDEVMPEMSHQMWKKIANEFAVKWQFPNCIGAIDGKHVSIHVSDFLEF